MHFFVNLGSLVEKRWSDKNYDEDCFPEIASQALLEYDPSEHVFPQLTRTIPRVQVAVPSDAFAAALFARGYARESELNLAGGRTGRP